MMKKYYVFLGAMAAFCLVTIVASYLLRQNPARDQQVSEDLSSLASAIDTQYLSDNRLPESRQAISIPDEGLRKRAAAYEYRKLSQTKYELCATFKTKRRSNSTFSGPSQMPDPSQHDAGRQCFIYTQLPVANPLTGVKGD